VQLDLERGTIYLPTDLRHPDLSYSRFRQSLKTIYLGRMTKRSETPLFIRALDILLVTYLLTHFIHRAARV